MSHPIESSTLRILNSQEQTTGTGFLVSETLITQQLGITYLSKECPQIHLKQSLRK